MSTFFTKSGASPPVSNQQQRYASIIPQLPEPFKSFGWEFSGFGRRARKLFDADPEEIEDLNLRTIIPDAFYYDAENKCLIALEIVESHDIDNAKAQRYCDYAFALGETSLLLLIHYPNFRATVGVENFFAITLDAYRLLQTEPKTAWRDAMMKYRQKVEEAREAA